MKREIPALTGLRGVAALAVLFFHVRMLKGNVELTFGIFDPLSKYGYLGVDVFFILSGYLLFYIYHNEFECEISAAGYRKFFLARFARIYPLHFATTFLMFGVYLVGLHMGVHPSAEGGYSTVPLMASLLLVMEWFKIRAPNPGSWSISVELASYIAFPIYVWASARVSRYWPIFVIPVAATIAAYADHNRLLQGMMEFLIGCSIYGLLELYPRLAGKWLNPFNWFFSLPAIVFIGEISYSVYLLQWAIWAPWKHLGDRVPYLSNHPYALVSLACVSVIAAAIVSYYLFENPSRKFIRSLAGVRPKEPATAH